MTQNDAPHAATTAPSPIARQGIVKRWSRLNHFAARARSNRTLFWTSATFAVIYNLLGCIDVMSTVIGLQTNLATEGNPVIALLMGTLSNGWVLVKLGLQLLVTMMILWYPHRIVLGIFGLSMIVTAIAVFKNLQIIGVL